MSKSIILTVACDTSPTDPTLCTTTASLNLLVSFTPIDLTIISEKLNYLWTNQFIFKQLNNDKYFKNYL